MSHIDVLPRDCGGLWAGVGAGVQICHVCTGKQMTSRAHAQMLHSDLAEIYWSVSWTVYFFLWNSIRQAMFFGLVLQNMYPVSDRKLDEKQLKLFG